MPRRPGTKRATLNPAVKIAWEVWLDQHDKDAFVAIREVAMAVEEHVWKIKKEWKP